MDYIKTKFVKQNKTLANQFSTMDSQIKSAEGFEKFSNPSQIKSDKSKGTKQFMHIHSKGEFFKRHCGIIKSDIGQVCITRLFNISIIIFNSSGKQ